jgi:hypothetical protein
MLIKPNAMTKLNFAQGNSPFFEAEYADDNNPDPAILAKLCRISVGVSPLVTYVFHWRIGP